MPEPLPIYWHRDKCLWHRRERCLFRHETPRDEIPLWTEKMEELQNAWRQDLEELGNEKRKLAGIYIPSLSTPGHQTTSRLGPAERFDFSDGHGDANGHGVRFTLPKDKSSVKNHEERISTRMIFNPRSA